MKKVEQIGDRYYIDGNEVELVKPKDKPKQTPGQKWATKGKCPLNLPANKFPRSPDGSMACCGLGCQDCIKILAAVYDAALANLPSVEDWLRQQKDIGAYLGSGICSKIDCKGLVCDKCVPLAKAAAQSYREFAQKAQQ